jgi:hypothetical protein
LAPPQTDIANMLGDRMNRRQLLNRIAGATAAASLPRLAFARSSNIALSLRGGPTGQPIPVDYVGLSYEAAQLANPAFFAPSNRSLIALFRELSPSGVLRIGGGSSEYTSYSDADPMGTVPFEVFGPDTSKTVKHGTVTTAVALRNLRGFLDATGWTCIWGLNFGQGSKENAAAEAAAVQRVLGPRLALLQIGNEPDSFRNRYRPADWTPTDFIREWNMFHDAVAAAAPGVRFAGPDISNKLDYLTAFAAEAPKHPDVVMLTGHYYAMGPAGNPEATIAQLMEPDPSTTTMHADRFAIVQAACRTAGLPFRLTEGNSCWNGGQPGVSDTLASALWCADAMLRFAQLGWVGVNWHGGGNGRYSPIVGAPSTGFTRRPEYYGIQFAQLVTGGTFIPVTLVGASRFVTAYALQTGRAKRVAIVNKDLVAATVTLPTPAGRSAMLLTGPARDAKDGTMLSKTAIKPGRTVTVPAHSAILYTL